MRPVWDGERWRIRVMRDGRSFSFSSSTPGAKGRKEVVRKYEAWLYGEGSGEKTVGQVADEYLADLKARRGETAASYYQYEGYIRCYIAPKCASKKICKMTLRDWQGVINTATRADGGPLSHKTLVNIRSIIMSIIKFAYADYQCEPLRGELYIPAGHSRSEKAILQKGDIARLFEPSALWYWPAFCFMVITGLRPGEALGLQVDDIEASCVRVRRAINTRNFITEGKNKNAKRIVPIGATARAILERTIERNKDLKLRTPWIFCGIDGGPGNQRTMKNQWVRLAEERHLPGTMYSLRHTFISLVKNTLPEASIKSYVGHSALTPTLGIYGHEVDGDARKAADIIDLTFNFARDLSGEK